MGAGGEARPGGSGPCLPGVRSGGASGGRLGDCNLISVWGVRSTALLCFRRICHQRRVGGSNHPGLRVRRLGFKLVPGSGPGSPSRRHGSLKGRRDSTPQADVTRLEAVAPPPIVRTEVPWRVRAGPRTGLPPSGSSSVRVFLRQGLPPSGSSSVRVFLRQCLPPSGSSSVRVFLRPGLPPSGSSSVRVFLRPGPRAPSTRMTRCGRPGPWCGYPPAGPRPGA